MLKRSAIPHPNVALRKESVDRNVQGLGVLLLAPPSLSARRAWIEILSPCRQYRASMVALRKESVDRNVLVVPAGCWLPGRSPQGERG